jgi:TRAP-type C4-dicarboxylate transport system permease large subunit
MKRSTFVKGVLAASILSVLLIPCWGHAAEKVVSLPVHSSVIMIIIFLIYLVRGSIIDDLAFLILATPIFFPAIIKSSIFSWHFVLAR